MTEPEDLRDFKHRVWTLGLAAQKRHDWCDTFFHVMRSELGLTGSDPSLAEPAEDGVYRVDGFTYFFIRFDGEWIRTALVSPRDFTSAHAETWDDMIQFMREKNLLRNGDGAPVLVKI